MKTAFQHIQITPCAARVALNNRGLFGFHDSPSCPDCIKTNRGYTVHDGSTILAPLVGYTPDAQTVISEFPVYFTR